MRLVTSWEVFIDRDDGKTIRAKINQRLVPRWATPLAKRWIDWWYFKRGHHAS